MLVVMALALMPSEVRMPSTGWDKSDHLLAFFVIALLGGGVAYPGRTALVLTGLLAYAALIEVLQSFTSHRFAERGDLLADVVGLLLGWMVLQLVRMQAKMVA
jgi:VanZ family protein